MLTNERRLNLVHRLNVLQQEMAEIARILSENPCPTTDEDIERAVQLLLNNNGHLLLESLEKTMETGLTSDVMATYYPNAEKNQLRPYSPMVDEPMLLVIKRLIEINSYKVTEGHEDASAFCVYMVPGDSNGKTSPFKLAIVEEEPAQPLVKIGPNKKIRQLVSDETLAQQLEMAKVSRKELEAHIERLLSEKLMSTDERWVAMVSPEVNVKADGSH